MTVKLSLTSVLLCVLILNELLARGSAQTPDVRDPCANADTQKHVGDIAYFPSIEALSGHGDGDSENQDSSDRAKRGATSSQSLLWPGGIVYYTFSSQYSESDKEQVYEAMRHWENNTCLRFRARTIKKNYVNFIKSSGCCSYVGNLGFGEQGLSLGGNCLKFEVILHEIGHAIGFWHEHARPDRDNYIDVLRSNILPNYLKNFYKLNSDITDDLGIGYDYNSIMHYNHNAFTRFSGASTLQAKSSGIPLGQAVELSPLDILQTNLLYSCEDSNPPRSSLPDPVPDSPPVLPFSCGSILSANSSSFSHFTNVTYSNATDCNWLIQPKGRFKITIELRNIVMEDSNNCNDSFIAVYQGMEETGRLKARICRSYSNFQRLYLFDNSFIRFHSKPSNSSRGLSVKYWLSDIDECISFARCSHNCLNTYGGYTCSCRNGYYLSGDGRTCFDINECALHNGGCSEVCTNSGGSYYCSCSTPGYVLQSNQKTCRRPGPTCSVNNGECTHTCTELSDRRVCSCPVGYELEPDGKTCLDIHECRYRIDNCQHECVNTLGSYYCLCKSGFHLSPDGRTCAPDRVCHINNGGCSQKCQSLGNLGASCYCTRGYTLGEDGRTCEDVNECEERKHLCHQICVNTNGSFVCACRDGYELTSQVGCNNIDECRRGTSECQFSDYCRDNLGSYSCGCPRGYTLAPDGHSCLDVDECDYTHRYYCSQTCVNTVGSFECACRDGYVLQAGWYCYDINECLSSNQCDSDSGASCRNLDGSYACYCTSGYRLHTNGWECVDIDECHENLHFCGSRQYCVNKKGSYMCSSTPPPTTEPPPPTTEPPPPTTEPPPPTTEPPPPTTEPPPPTTEPPLTSKQVTLASTEVQTILTRHSTSAPSSTTHENNVVTDSNFQTTSSTIQNASVYATTAKSSLSTTTPELHTISTSKDKVEYTSQYINTEDELEGTNEYVVATDSVTKTNLKFTSNINNEKLTTSYSEPATTIHPTTQSSNTTPTPSSSCGGFISEYAGTIATENWPRTYPVNIDCEWTLRAPSSNQIIKLSFQTTAFGIAGNMPRCKKDWVKIISHHRNKTWGPFCGFDVPSNISIKADDAVIKFHAGPKHGRARKGFSISYEVWDTCIQLPPPLSPEGYFRCNSVVSLNQKFGPPDFPAFITSQTSTSCVWVFFNWGRARLKFLYFDVPKSDGCKDANVKLYNDYYRHGRSLTATLCGNLTEQERTVNISTTHFSIELNRGPLYANYRGIHAVFQNSN